jgi:hypothetical protein
MEFADDFSDSQPGGAVSEPDLPDLRELPVLNEMYDFDIAGQTLEMSPSVVSSGLDLAQSVPPSSSDRGRSESHIPWASAVVEDPHSDDEDGLFADDVGPTSDDELDEAESTSADPPKWKIHHARGDHRLNGMCMRSVRDGADHP